MSATLSRRRLLGAAAGAWAAASLRPAAAQTAPAEVAPGLFVRRGLDQDATKANQDAIANLAFVIGRDSVAVIDPGGSRADGDSLRRAIAAKTNLPVRWVVMTHGHPDHLFGAEAFLPDKPVFVGHARLPEMLAARGEFYRQGLERILGAGPEAIEPPGKLIHGTAEIDLGGRVLELTAHPQAHSDADLSVIDRGAQVLLAGDLLFVERVPSLDGNLKGWIEVLDDLAKLPLGHAVPGHGPPLVAWPSAAKPLQRYLADLRDETRRAIAKGVPLEKAVNTVGRGERGKWKLFDDYQGRNVTEAYRELEWE
ncbi:MAG TPA: quinoprotein relay system zinc metallohydrolase 2 [Magnetospirillaceae bacterium]|nr:quinoprotein relay system zinc metallohydrolase 2 [Magnetospirillaceae bacterium]